MSFDKVTSNKYYAGSLKSIKIFILISRTFFLNRVLLRHAVNFDLVNISKTNETIDRVRETIQNNHRLTIKEVAEDSSVLMVMLTVIVQKFLLNFSLV